MSLRRTVALALVAALLMGLGLHPASAAATPLAEQTDAYRAALERAMQQYQGVLATSNEIDGRVEQATAELDQVIAEQQQAQARLTARAVSMYRAGDSSTLAMLFSSSSVQDLSARLEMLDMLARQDARDIRQLKDARARAKESAEALIALQAEQAAQLDAAAAEVARAKQDLAGSEAALREYEARVAAAAAAAAAARRASVVAPGNPNQNITGSGEWRAGVASHYGLNFTGKGASGVQIGPYSMIVAHRTLPFGTLIEFEYNGKRCVASVQDRGPHVEGREFDLGPGVARVLGFSGVHEVRYRIVSQ